MPYLPIAKLSCGGDDVRKNFCSCSANGSTSYAPSERKTKNPYQSLWLGTENFSVLAPGDVGKRENCNYQCYDSYGYGRPESEAYSFQKQRCSGCSHSQHSKNTAPDILKEKGIGDGMMTEKRSEEENSRISSSKRENRFFGESRAFVHYVRRELFQEENLMVTRKEKNGCRHL